MCAMFAGQAQTPEPHHGQVDVSRSTRSLIFAALTPRPSFSRLVIGGPELIQSSKANEICTTEINRKRAGGPACC